jgi:hypothetical protein
MLGQTPSYPTFSMTSELRFKGFHLLYLISKGRSESGLNANHLHPIPTHPDYFKSFQELPHPSPNFQKPLLFPMTTHHHRLEQEVALIVFNPILTTKWDLAGGVVGVVASL